MQTAERRLLSSAGTTAKIRKMSINAGFGGDKIVR